MKLRQLNVAVLLAGTGGAGAAQIALEIVTKDRGDLVSVVVENYGTLRPLLLDFARAGDDAQVLLELIRSAESRMAVAMVKGNPPEDNGDREPVA